jgi:hypothetical protein
VKFDLDLYDWVRAGLSIHQAEVSAVEVEPADGGKERVTATLDVIATLWGPPGEPTRHIHFVRHQSRWTRQKFRDPVWGRVSEIERGMSVILVTPQPDADVRDVTFIDHVKDPDDPVVTAIQSVVEVEKAEPPDGRIAHYVRWLEDGPALHRRFAAEAVSKDADLPRDDGHNAAVVQAYVRAIEAKTDGALQCGLVEYATEGLIGRLQPQQATPLIRLVLRAAEGDDEVLQMIVYDWLRYSARPEYFIAAETTSAWAASELSDELELGGIPTGERARIEAIIGELRPR